MSADPHYWVGYLATAIAQAIGHKDMESLRGSLDDFMRSATATAPLCAVIREEMADGRRNFAAAARRRNR